MGISKPKVVAALLLGAAVFTSSAAAGPGALDPSFGSGGLVTADFVGAPSEGANAVAVRSDGKIVAAGLVKDQYNPNGFAAARFNSDGTPDSSFGSGGQVTTDFPGFNYEVANALVLQPDGKSVAAGSVSSYETGEVFALARYNADGTLDTMFGSGGLVATPFAMYTYGGARDVVLQPDGKLVVTGTVQGNGGQALAVARYNPNGSLDSSFGSGGVAVASSFYYWEGPDARAIAVQPDGRIVVAGTAAAQFVLARFTTDGALDPTFGTGGIARPAYGHAFALALQPDGKIVEAGQDLSGFQLLVARVNADGTPDSSFAGGGTASIGFMPTAVYVAAEALEIQANGKIVTAGTASGNNLFFALARFNADGTVDAGFGAAGRVLTTFPSMIGQAVHGLALQSDGAIVAAGSAYRDPGDQVFALARYAGDSVATKVAIDILPGSSTNPIKLSRAGIVPVAILTTSGFDATTVDPKTVCFGDQDNAGERDCTEAPGGGHVEDVNGDGRADLLLRYDVLQTGIDPGDTLACLTGSTFAGSRIEGCDTITTL